uniref:Uncharacterized protein n=1 Tax=Rhizochromulina marina TaxID=1034831 RepID=A0A7S2S7G7_9STRA|mmetsp:Transcript_25975/g.75750  ORF Transcript_25975/g.75750 Transcript_25975/m.75750 type:complete len:291 (+) Transcript_25975:50-922(+)
MAAAVLLGQGVMAWWQVVTAGLPQGLVWAQSREVLLACLVLALVLLGLLSHLVLHPFFAAAPPSSGGGAAAAQRRASGSPWKGWDASVKKENSYYFAHNRRSDGLRPEDFDMEKPRRLDATPAASSASPLVAVAASSAKAPATEEPALPGRLVREYAFCDEEEEVELLLELEGWNWKELGEDAVVTRVKPRELIVELYHGQLGARHLVLKPLFGEIARAFVKKRGAKRLILILEKKTPGAWETLLGRGPASALLRRQSSEFEDVEIEEEDDDEDEEDAESGTDSDIEDLE